MSRPVVAMTGELQGENIHLHQRYFNALWDAGMMPVALPARLDWTRAEEYADRFDGFLFTGGGDVDPKYYMEDRHPKCGEPNPERDSFELSLLTSVMLRDKPVLGICRGIQLLNVGLGGSLYQHVEGHANSDDPVWHDVYVREGTLLYDIVGKEKIRVNSWHHQMVKGTGKSVKVCADIEDGRTEAIWIPGRKFFLGVQWHPEMYYAQDEDAAKIFKAFAASMEM
ncbi:MAG: gamma-glutamyl-gamma-aminobutyrate hydrolase family protein [Clostridia bacterium]|nr:gamma-glutamyl-gamma-aminobutyrate hydrolase family protein [Clostridia bacterium]